MLAGAALRAMSNHASSGVVAPGADAAWAVGARVVAAALERETPPPARTFDVVVFGATGFTGQLTAAYFARKAAAIAAAAAAAAGGGGNGGGGARESERPFTWAIAGRSLQKLNEVEGVPASVPRIVADSGDREALNAMARQAKVVASTVGPYTL
jgi:hypothetical protein